MFAGRGRGAQLPPPFPHLNDVAPTSADTPRANVSRIQECAHDAGLLMAGSADIAYLTSTIAKPVKDDPTSKIHVAPSMAPPAEDNDNELVFYNDGSAVHESGVELPPVPPSAAPAPAPAITDETTYPASDHHAAYMDYQYASSNFSANAGDDYADCSFVFEGSLALGCGHREHCIDQETSHSYIEQETTRETPLYMAQETPLYMIQEATMHETPRALSRSESLAMPAPASARGWMGDIFGGELKLDDAGAF